MKRLTDKHRDLCLSCELCIDDECDHLNHSELCSNAKRYKRLADIEDILGDDYDLDRLRELSQADWDGRCAILSKPMKPIVCKPNDTDVYCPNCGETLSGGWPLSDDDEHRNMCQCPHCGQSIDENWCEVDEATTEGGQQ